MHIFINFSNALIRSQSKQWVVFLVPQLCLLYRKVSHLYHSFHNLLAHHIEFQYDALNVIVKLLRNASGFSSPTQAILSPVPNICQEAEMALNTQTRHKDRVTRNKEHVLMKVANHD